MAAEGSQLFTKSVPTKLPTESTQMITILIKWVGGGGGGGGGRFCGLERSTDYTNNTFQALSSGIGFPSFNQLMEMGCL